MLPRLCAHCHRTSFSPQFLLFLNKALSEAIAQGELHHTRLGRGGCEISERSTVTKIEITAEVIAERLQRTHVKTSCIGEIEGLAHASANIANLETGALSDKVRHEVAKCKKGKLSAGERYSDRRPEQSVACRRSCLSKSARHSRILKLH